MHILATILPLIILNLVIIMHVDDGGGIYTLSSNHITINNTQFSYNNAKYGGGINAYYSNNITINNTQFSYNNAVDDGGGIYTYYSNHITINNTQFSYNNAVDDGGGIYTYYSNHITINNTQFSYNNANYGGGIDAAYSNNITINNTQFNRNNVNYSGGGLSTVASAVTAMNSQFEHNKAFYEGGGIYIDDSSISVIDSVFSGNNAIVAGGGAVSMSISNMLILSSLSIESSSFVDNYGQIGGALLITDTTASSLCKMTNIVNVTFWSNEAISGAALYMYSSCSSIVFNMSYFITNFASNGGTVVLDINYNIPQVMQNTIFDSNVASYDAGAILIYRSNLHIKDCDFISNIAGQNGGA
eukprot:12505_1